ncbi:MAG: sulfatase [Armatimonadetes bacterium]|nr:sulfatase [Armatimonadota bacterium]
MTSDRRTFLRTGALAAAGLLARRRGQAQAKPPNIVFILADDLGWCDTSFTGSRYYRTPNVERLAQRGVYFPCAYSASPLCSPTRASALTGCHPARTGITTPGCHEERVQLAAERATKAPPTARRLECTSATRLPLTYVTLAERFKAAGYATGHFGKWHLGREPYDPLHQGFDVDIPHWYGPGPAGSFVAPWKFPNFRERTPGEHLEDRMGDEVVSFMTVHRDRPFFIDYWQFSVHAPFDAKQDLIARYRASADPANPQHCPTYAAMVQSFDDNLGKVMDALDRLGLTDNTLLLFYSDNGGNMYNTVDGTTPTSNAPLRGGKGTVWEGGVRVPCLASWPGVTRPGTRNDSLINSCDIYPTLLEAAGLPPTPDQPCDGVSQMAALRGGQGPRQESFVYFPHSPGVPDTLPPSVTVRQGDWKLIRLFCEGPELRDRQLLYNLRDDVGETTDLTDREPARVAALGALIDRFLADTKALTPLPNPAWRAEARSSYHGWATGANGHLSASETPEGLALEVTDGDPMLISAEMLDLPAGEYTMALRLRSSAKGNGLVFRSGAAKRWVPGSGTSFAIEHDGAWHEYRVALTPAQPIGALRLDLATAPGRQTLAWVRLLDAQGKLVRDWAFATAD